jgi:hypothetical protein
MLITKVPEMVVCAGGVLVSSEAGARDPVLTVKLNAEGGDRYELPLSERATTQLTEVITGWRAREPCAINRKSRSNKMGRVSRQLDQDCGCGFSCEPM